MPSVSKTGLSVMKNFGVSHTKNVIFEKTELCLAFNDGLVQTYRLSVSVEISVH